MGPVSVMTAGKCLTARKASEEEALKAKQAEEAKALAEQARRDQEALALQKVQRETQQASTYSYFCVNPPSF